MSNNMWRFPASNHGDTTGMTPGDSETFKKNPFSAFAREILQNSIDARASDEEPTRVDFSLFKIKSKDIPGCNELAEAMRRCKEFFHYKKDYVEEYNKMLNVLNSDEVTCLRVSDFNTTGLIGVETPKQQNNKFLALTKGTGVSEKAGEMAGGSKGVGKNAAYNMSSIRTVFYSTHSDRDINDKPGDYIGSLGVAKFVSGYVDDIVSEDRDHTQGTGFFSKDDNKNAIGSLINLDSSFNQRTSNCGTDIYIVGFNNEAGWEKEIINSLLDSFMAAILYNELEVNVNGINITKDNIESIVYDKDIINKNKKSNIVSQYRLLTNKDSKVQTYDLDTEYGVCQLYILPLEKDEEDLATHKCSMIRHPLMKIKDESLGQSFRVSAMCIIGKGKLGEKLRSIENAQHIDWEVNRIKDLSERKEIQNVLNDIKEQIKARVIECLKLGDDEPIDPSGAGDYLPDLETGDSNAGTDGNQKPTESVSVSAPKKNRAVTKNPTQENENGDGLEPDIGEVDESNDGDVMHPTGENDRDGQGRHPGSESSGEKEGDEVVFKRQRLSGVKYNVICINKNEGLLKVVFVAPIDFETCYLNISLLDDSNNAVPVLIESMKCNGVDISSDDKVEYGPFTIKQNKKVVLEIKTNMNGYFASEVKVICK